MQDATASTQTLQELIKAHGFKLAWLAAELGLNSRQALSEGRYASGKIGPHEIDKLAEVLRLPREQVEAAVRESARRYEAAKAGTTPLAQPKGGAA